MKGTVSRRGPNRYLVRVFLGKSAEGVRMWHTETVRGDKREAERRCRELVTAHERGQLTKPTGRTLSDFLSEWLRAIRQKVRQRTWDEYERLANRYLASGLGKIEIEKITPLQIQKVYLAMSERGLSGLTVRRLHTVLNQALRQAVRWRMLSHNPASDVDLPRKVQRRVMRSFTPEQARAFVSAARNHRYGLVLIFALQTGMRPEEFIALQWSDLDLVAGTARVERVLVRPKGGGWRFEEPKTKSSRRNVALDPRLVRELKTWKAKQSEMRLQLGSEWTRDFDFVFTSEVGQPLNATSLLRWAFKPILKMAGITESFRMYDLRHTHASLLFEAREHPKVVSERLGHSTITLTMDTYSHLLPGMQEQAAKKVGDVLYKEG